MATTADFKNGLYFNYEGKPVSIIWFQHVKPGKGPAFVKTKLRNLENGKILDRTFTAGEKIDPIIVERRPYTYLYKDDMGYNFGDGGERRPYEGGTVCRDDVPGR